MGLLEPVSATPQLLPDALFQGFGYGLVQPPSGHRDATIPLQALKHEDLLGHIGVLNQKPLDLYSAATYWAPHHPFA